MAHPFLHHREQSRHRRGIGRRAGGPASAPPARGPARTGPAAPPPRAPGPCPRPRPRETRAASAARNRVAAASSPGAALAAAASCSAGSSPPPASRASTAVEPEGQAGRAAATAAAALDGADLGAQGGEARVEGETAMRLGLFCSLYVPPLGPQESSAAARHSPLLPPTRRRCASFVPPVSPCFSSPPLPCRPSRLQRPPPPPPRPSGDADWLYRGSDIPPDPAWRFGTLPNGLHYAVRRNALPARPGLDPRPHRRRLAARGGQ